MSFLSCFAKMVGVEDGQSQEALADEGRARRAVLLSRRGFFAAGATMAAAPLIPKRAYSFVFAPQPLSPSNFWLAAAASSVFLLPYLAALGGGVGGSR